MSKVIYRTEVQLTPKLHGGCMKYYWAIHQINEDGKFTIADGFNKTHLGATNTAYWKTLELKLV